MLGQLFIFEGPDGTGKTTLSLRLVDWFASRGRRALHVRFPGQCKGTLGELVYNLHHYPERYELREITPIARQLLHIAAHIDALHNTIIPRLECGDIVVMDRFWWSTVVYGKAEGIDSDSLRLMIDLELCHWLHHRPTAIFLLERSTPVRTEHSPELYDLLSNAYADLAEQYKRDYRIHRISTSGTVEESFGEILSEVI